MKNKKKKILVIGGTGFIGFHLLKQTSQLGWGSVSISKNKPKKSKLVKKVKYLSVNIKNFKDLKNKIKGNFDYIVNLTDVPNKNLNPEIKKLIYFFLNKKIKKFLQIGSSAEYGNIKKPHSETLKCRPSSSYGKKKLEITNFLLKRFKQNSFPVIILRPFQVYGEKDNRNKILPYVLNKCLNNKKFDLIDYEAVYFSNESISTYILYKSEVKKFLYPLFFT